MGISSDISAILHRQHLVYADVRSWPWLAVCNEYTRALYINGMFCKAEIIGGQRSTATVALFVEIN